LDGENQVGRISKQWGGFVKEAFTDADTFGVTCKSRRVNVAFSNRYRGFGKCNAFWSITLPLGFQHNG